MGTGQFHIVTGALGYSGKAIAERLIARGHRVRTLTNSVHRPNPFGDALEVLPFTFEDHAHLVDALRGADVLYNTYWVRFNHSRFTFDEAVVNSKRLFAAAMDAGVKRIVHVSILHPERGSGLAYYEGKLEVERALMATGIPHAVLRPGVLFGGGDILVNNIAWVLRHLPIFGVFGDGRYKIQPMHVNDFADLAVSCAATEGNSIEDAVGPETFAFKELVRTVAQIIGVRRPVFSCPPMIGLAVSKLVNPCVGDVIITREEIDGLMRGLLASDTPRTGTTRLTDWTRDHRESLGRRYASEVGRRVKRDVSYEHL